MRPFIWRDIEGNRPMAFAIEVSDAGVHVVRRADPAVRATRQLQHCNTRHSVSTRSIYFEGLYQGNREEGKAERRIIVECQTSIEPRIRFKERCLPLCHGRAVAKLRRWRATHLLTKILCAARWRTW